jgi:hypothetical protein
MPEFRFILESVIRIEVEVEAASLEAAVFEAMPEAEARLQDELDLGDPPALVLMRVDGGDGCAPFDIKQARALWDENVWEYKEGDET